MWTFREQRNRFLLAFAFSLLTVLGTSIDMRNPNLDVNIYIHIMRAMSKFSMTQIFLLVGLCAFYFMAFQYIGKSTWTLRDKVCATIPAMLFSSFMVVGYSFAQTNSLDLVLNGSTQKIKASIAFIGYGIIFFVLIASIYEWAPHLKLTQEIAKSGEMGPLGQYKKVLMTHPFGAVFCTLFLLYIPYIVLSYPAIVMGDTNNQVLQGFNFLDGTSSYLNLIDKNIRINGHHPVAHTMLIHVCLILGKQIFNSYNVGIFLAAFIQFLTICAVVASSIKSLVRFGVKGNILIGLIIYFSFAPRIQNYMFLITKDVLATAMLLLFSLSLYEIISGNANQNKSLLKMILSGIGMGLLRNDGKYIIIGSVIIISLLEREGRKTLLKAGITLFFAFGLFFNIIMPTLRITPGSRREALSVPFQQTARYFRDYGESVTEEEQKAIDKVLQHESLGSLYNPTLSDPVKASFNEMATAQDLKAYFKMWFQMGLKHPGVYLQATLNNYYNYFYPGEKLANLYSYDWSKHCMASGEMQQALQEINCTFHYPKAIDEARNAYESLRETIFELPILWLFKCPAAYVWTLILFVFYFIKEREWKSLALLTPLVLSVGVCFLGPCNGEYFRYLYGVSVSLPVVAILSLLLLKQKTKGAMQNG